MKYATLFAMQKKEEEKDEEERIIHVYIPLTCSICPKSASLEKWSKQRNDIENASNVLKNHKEWVRYDAKLAERPKKDEPSALEVVSALTMIDELLDSTFNAVEKQQ